MLPVLLVLLVVVPLVELYVLIQVGQVIGPLPTIALLVLMSVLGGWLLRREGGRAWRRFNDALRTGRVPTTEVADGALVVLGGALLLTPGFATDVVGLLCVLPGSRAVVRRVLVAAALRRFGPAAVLGGLAAQRQAGRASGTGRVVDGSVVDGSVADGDADGRAAARRDRGGPTAG